MAVTDIILLVPLLFGAFKGFRRGLVMEIIHLVTFFIAIILAFLFLDRMAELLAPHLGHESKLLPYIAFIVIFLGTILLMTVIGKAIKKILHLTIFGTIDSALGLALGTLKWALIISVFIWVSGYLSFSLDEYFESSLIYGYVKPIAPFVFSSLSSLAPVGENIRNLIEEYLAE